MSQDAEIIRRLTQRFSELNREVVFVHSDIRGGFDVDRPSPFDRTQFLKNHFDAIRETTGDADLWFPQFCYTFSDTRVFDQRGDKSHVGHLTEYVRTEVSTWRTPVPFFSVSGTGDEPVLPDTSPIDALGKGSVFDTLFERDALILNYGCDLSSLTHIHYCESLAACPYRYVKDFEGCLIDMTGTERSVEVRLHVRPLEYEMTYDWERLQADLARHGILERIRIDDREFQIMQVRQLTDYWLEKLVDEPLFFLTNETKSWVAPKLDELGRGFVIDDFELNEVTNHHG